MTNLFAALRAYKDAVLFARRAGRQQELDRMKSKDLYGNMSVIELANNVR